MAPMCAMSPNAGSWCARVAIRPGGRGFGPRRASNYYRNIEDYVKAANEALFVMPQIEDIATLDVIDEYLAVPGIDAVAIGPNDLSGTTGLFRQHQHPINRNALDKIIARAKAAGIPVCLGINSKRRSSATSSRAACACCWLRRISNFLRPARASRWRPIARRSANERHVVAWYVVW